MANGRRGGSVDRSREDRSRGLPPGIKGKFQALKPVVARVVGQSVQNMFPQAKSAFEGARAQQLFQGYDPRSDPRHQSQGGPYDDMGVYAAKYGTDVATRFGHQMGQFPGLEPSRAGQQVGDFFGSLFGGGGGQAAGTRAPTGQGGLFDTATERGMYQQYLGGVTPEQENYEAAIDSALFDLNSQRDTMLSLARQLADTAGAEAAEPYNERIAQINQDIAELEAEKERVSGLHEQFRTDIEGPFQEAETAFANIDLSQLEKIAEAGLLGTEQGFDESEAAVLADLDRVGGFTEEGVKALMADVTFMEDELLGIQRAEHDKLEATAEAKARFDRAQNLANKFQWQAGSARDQKIIEAEYVNAVKSLERARDEAEKAKQRAMEQARRGVWSSVNLPQTTPHEFAGQQLQSYFAGLNISPNAAQAAMQLVEDMYARGETADDLQDYATFLQQWTDAGQDANEGVVVYNAMVGAMGTYETAFESYVGDSWGLLNQPSLQGRADHITGMVPSIEAAFGVHSVGQYRNTNALGGTGYPHSDHYWGGALDFGGSFEAMDNLAAAAKNWPGVKYVLWQTKGHYDHVHISFYPPCDVKQLPSHGGGSHAVGECR